MPYWTDEEKIFLRQNYKKTDTKIIAQKLNRSVSTVRQQAILLGIATNKNSFALQPGTAFNRWVVIEETDNKSSDGSNKYLCLCQCGKTKEVRRASLIDGTSKSCGCLTSDRVREAHSLGDGETSFNCLYTTCRRSARRKTRDLEFSLTPEEHRCIVVQNCHYCGAFPVKFSRYETKIRSDKKNNVKTCITDAAVGRSWIYVNGVDRIDSDNGYTSKNCVPCCSQCNTAKMDYSEKQFIDHAIKIVKFQNRKK